MADIKIGIDVNDGGSTAKVNKNAEQLRNTMRETADIASKIRVPMATSAARQGVSASQPKSAAYMAAAGPEGQASATNLGRGVAGATGAAGRDFAAQAQGLGGLVHVYATFAANLYAVSAAFTALSKAADISNMVKGLDQLGAQGGRSLSALSKQMVSVADGAISMRDAISSTAISSAGGMSNANILRMTEVAKKASLALGRDMPDSMDRLTKGIIKIQPELLDELGIMARVIPAQEAYARSVGKTASSLTDYEKRQAFANAVLEEGERKFNAIKLDANPYSKILASMTNLLQTGLELINKVFSPLVNILASSPTALTAAMVAVSAVLLKQAVPALGFLKENLERSREIAQKTANLKSIDAKASQVAELENVRAHVENLADVKVAAADRAQKKLNAIEAASGFKPGEATQRILSKASQEVTPDDYKTIETTAKGLETKGKPLLAKSYRDLAIAIRESADAENTYGKIVDENTKKLQQKAHWTSSAGQVQALADRANLAAASRSITATAAQTASVRGFKEAMSESFKSVAEAMVAPQKKTILNDLNEQIDIIVPKMGILRGGWTLLASGIGAATSALSRFLSFLSPWLIAASILGPLLSMLFDKLSTNQKAYDDLTATIDRGTDAVRLAGDVLDNYNKIPFGTAETTQNIIARSNAVSNLTDTIKDQYSAYVKVLEASSEWDKITEGFWNRFGKGAGNKLADNINLEVKKAIDLIGTSEGKVEATKKISDILGVAPNTDAIEKAITNLGKSGTAGAAGLGKLATGLNEIGKKSKESISSLENLKTTTEAVARANIDLNNTLAPKELTEKLGFALVEQAIALGKALENPKDSLIAINDLLKDSKNLGMFSSEQSKDLVNYMERINSITASTKDQKKAVEDLSIALEAQKTKQDSFKLAPGIKPGTPLYERELAKSSMAQQTPRADISYDVKETANLLSRTKANRDIAVRESAELYDKFVKSQSLVINAYAKGSQLIQSQIEYAGTKAAVAVGQAMLSGLSGRGIAEAEAGLTKQDIAARQSLVDATLQNTLATIANTAAYNSEKAKTEREKLGPQPMERTGGRFYQAKGPEGAQYNLLTKSMGISEQVQEVIDSINKGQITSKDVGNLVDAAIQQRNNALASSLLEIQKVLGQSEAAKIGLGTEGKVADIQAGKKERQAELDYQLSLLSYAAAYKQATLDKLNLQTQFSGLYDEEIRKKATIAELDILDNKQAADRKKIQKDIDELEKSSLTSKAAADKTLELRNLEKQQGLEKDILNIKLAGSNAQAKAENLVLKIKQTNELKRLDDDLLSAQISAEKERLSVADSLGQVDKEFLARRNTVLGLDQQQITNAQALSSIEEGRADALVKMQAQKAADIELFGKIQPQTIAEQTRINDLYDKRYSTQSAIGKLSIDNLTTAGLAAEQQAHFNKLLETQNDLVSNLAKLFGDVGDALGQTVKGLFESVKAQDDLTKSKKLELDTLAKATKPGEQIDPKQEYAIESKYRDLSTKQELTSIANIAGSSKKMFGEKTAAYKILDTVEKASTLGKIAMQARQLAMEWGLLGAKEANTVATVAGAATEEASILGTLVAKGQSAILSALSAPFPLNFVAGAAMAATVAAIIGTAVGGVETVDMTGKTSAERQTAQGAGTVSGDDTAKSASIANSLQILNATSVEGLSYSNKMVELLTGIKDGISGVAKGVYGVVGLRTGSQFGTQEGSTGSSFLGGLFGSSSAKEITDAGLKITGSFADVMKNIGSTIKTYEDVLTTSSSSFLWFSSTSQSLNTQTKDLDSKIQDSLAKVFNNAGQLMITAGEKLGMSNQQVMDKLAQVDVSTIASLRGLKGKELDDALNSILGSMLDTASNAIFSSLAAYNKFGEGMLETTMRVVDGMEKVNLAMSSVGKSSIGTGMIGIEFSDAMITAAGGLSNFLDSTKNFADNFLTSSERLAPKQVALNKELTSLGFATNLTKDQFKQLVLGFQVTDDASAKTYSKLIGLSSAVQELAAASEDFASQAKDLDQKIYELLGNSEALNMSRQKELDALDASLRPRQRYINALTDEIALRDKLKSAYDTTNTSLTNSIKSLQDYKTALVAGASSILSPAEKYAQAKAIFAQTAAAANAVITTASSAADVATRDAAVSSLSKVSDNLLATSRIMNASGTQYAADFAAVTDAVDSTSSVLSTQKTDMQQQLGFLDTIATATDTTAQLLQKYLAAVSVTTVAQAAASASGSIAAGLAIPGHATGGLASGLSVVGERGPELVDFTNPGRVYSNRDSKALFNNSELIAEIKSLKEEVCKLREEQKEQTGHLIATTFTANARNAETINNGNAQALNQQNWKDRSKVSIV